MKVRCSVFALAVLAASGCATKPPLNFGLKDHYSAAKSAVIRPATRKEKTEPKANLAVRIFVNPMGGGSVAKLEYIDDVSGSIAGAKLKDFGAVHVKPGVYEVGAACVLGPWRGSFSVRVDAKPGRLYLLECYGNTAATMKLRVFEHDRKNGVRDHFPLSR